MCDFLCLKQKTAYEMRISDWSSDVCSSDLRDKIVDGGFGPAFPPDQLVAAAFQAKDVGGRTNQPVPEKAFDVDEAQPLYVHRVAADEVPQPLHPLRGTDQPARAAADDFVGLALGGRSAFRAMNGKDIGGPRQEDRRVGQECIRP